MKKRIVISTLIGVILGWSSMCAPVRAESCDMWTSNLGFMQPYDAFSRKPDFSIASINYTCKGFKKPALFVIDIDGGNSNDPRARYMLNGSERLYYNLFYDDRLTMIWGDGIIGVHYQQGKKPDADDRIQGAVAVMASIKPLQNPKIGPYSDHLVVTLTVEH